MEARKLLESEIYPSLRIIRVWELWESANYWNSGIIGVEESYESTNYSISLNIKKKT